MTKKNEQQLSAIKEQITKAKTKLSEEGPINNPNQLNQNFITAVSQLSERSDALRKELGDASLQIV